MYNRVTLGEGVRADTHSGTKKNLARTATTTSRVRYSVSVTDAFWHALSLLRCSCDARDCGKSRARSTQAPRAAATRQQQRKTADVARTKTQTVLAPATNNGSAVRVLSQALGV